MFTLQTQNPEPNTKKALEEDVITPLQGLTGGVWGLGVWRRYSLAKMKWRATSSGSTVSFSTNLGVFSVCRVGDNTMICTVDCVGPILIGGAATQFLALELPDGIQYICRQPIDPLLNSRAGVITCTVYNLATGGEGGYVVPGSSVGGGITTATFARWGGNFLNGNSYSLWAQWAMEVAVIGSKL